MKFGEEWGDGFPIWVGVCGLWRGIRMGWEDFRKNTQFVVWGENRVRFGQDGWCRDQPPPLAFLRLYSIATNIGRLQLSLPWQGWGRGKGKVEMFACLLHLGSK